MSVVLVVKSAVFSLISPYHRDVRQMVEHWFGGALVNLPFMYLEFRLFAVQASGCRVSLDADACTRSKVVVFRWLFWGKYQGSWRVCLLVQVLALGSSWGVDV